MNAVHERLSANVKAIRDRVETACNRAGRSADEPTLVAVTKYARLDWVRALVDLGHLDLGESRPQQLVERAPELPDSVRWHMIGRLQRNKARRTLPLASCIHTVDTFRLLTTLDRLAEETGTRPSLLLQVNVSGEAAKQGFDLAELAAGWQTVLDCEHVRVDGLMTMAPLAEEVEETRPVFRRLREFRDELAARSPESLPLPELSMGMSRDFEVAIEEGATLIRIGSALFEGLADDEPPGGAP